MNYRSIATQDFLTLLICFIQFNLKSRRLLGTNMSVVLTGLHTLEREHVNDMGS